MAFLGCPEDTSWREAVLLTACRNDRLHPRLESGQSTTTPAVVLGLLTPTHLPPSLTPAWTSVPTEVSRSEPIHIQETVAAAMMGAMSMGTSGLLGNVTGGGVATRSSALAVQTLRVSPSTWETLVETR